MNQAFRNALGTYGGTLITHIGLVNGSGAEPSGGSPAYARKAVTWTAVNDGKVSPNADLTFDIPAGFTVSAWRGFSALSGGTDYGGAELTDEAYAGQGTFKLLASGTYIDVNDPV